MAEVHGEEDGDADVRGEEVARGEASGEEDGEAVDQAEQREHHAGDVGAVRLHEALEWAFDTLGVCGLPESEVDDHTAHPRGHAP